VFFSDEELARVKDVLTHTQDQHLVGSGGVKFDRHSDLFETNIGTALCTSCLLLSARIDLTDKTGKKLPLNSEIYTHHIIVGGVEKRTIKPAVSAVALCKDGPQTRRGGFADFSASPHAIISIKGHEANAVDWATRNSESSTKGGLWIGKSEALFNSVEIVNYKEQSQDVYFTIDAEYLQLDSKPTNHSDVGFAATIVFDCAEAVMEPPKDKPETYSTLEYNVNKEMDIFNFRKSPIFCLSLLPANQRCRSTDVRFALRSQAKHCPS
jgi:hypothetical protein